MYSERTCVSVVHRVNEYVFIARNQTVFSVLFPKFVCRDGGLCITVLSAQKGRVGALTLSTDKQGGSLLPLCSHLTASLGSVGLWIDGA